MRQKKMAPGESGSASPLTPRLFAAAKKSWSPPNRTPQSPRGLRDEGPVTYSKRVVCTVVFAAAAVIVVAVVTIFYVPAVITRMFAGNGERSEERLSLSCRTEGCSRFEALLVDTLNASVDPCHDFKAYVSSRWLPDPSKELDEHWRYE
ncbi:hypothetical protein MRX96_040976 [Rhipicephalus microplus]